MRAGWFGAACAAMLLGAVASGEETKRESGWPEDERSSTWAPDDDGVGGSGDQSEVTVTTTDSSDDFRSPGEPREMLSIMAGGGAEGFTGALAPQINPGPAVSVSIGVQPLSWMG